MCGCPNVIEGKERFQGIFKEFVNLDPVSRVDRLYVVFMATAAFVFILQLLAFLTFLRDVSVLGLVLKVCQL